MAQRVRQRPHERVEDGAEMVGADEPGAIEKREIVPEAVFTVNRNWPSWVISTQHGSSGHRRAGSS